MKHFATLAVGLALLLPTFNTYVTADTASLPYTWRNVEIVGGGFVDGFTFSPSIPDLIYTRTDIGGPYRWDKNLKRWIPLTDWVGQDNGNLRGTEALAVDPTNPNRLYAAAGTYSNQAAAILSSNDQGRTWHESDVPFTQGGNENGRSIGERMAVDPNKPNVLYYGTRHDGLWISKDYAVSWSKINTFPLISDTLPPAPPPPAAGTAPARRRGFRPQGAGAGIVVLDPRFKSPDGSTSTIYVGVDAIGEANSILESSDSGSTWNPIPNQPQSLLPHHMVLASDGTLYVSYGNSVGTSNMTDGAVWKYDTKTLLWTDITPRKPSANSPGGYAGLAIDAQHPQTVMVATLDWFQPGDEIFRSTDSGAHWKAIGSLSVRDSKDAPWLNWGRGKTSFGWWFGALSIDPFHSGRVFYGTGATIWGTDEIQNADTGKTVHWKVWAKGIEETAALDLISPTTGAHLISALGDIGGFRHTDLNQTPLDGMSANPVFTNETSLDFASQNPSTIVRVGSGSTPTHGAISTDNGATWTPFGSDPPASRGSGTIAISADSKSIVWQTGGSVYFSHNNGSTWNASAGLPGASTGGVASGGFYGLPRGPQIQVASDRVEPATIYAVVGQTPTDNRGAQLDVSKDGGATFTVVGDPPALGRPILRVDPDSKGDLWLICGNNGLLHSTDGGTTFNKISGINVCDGLGFGKAAPGHTNSALYLVGTPAGYLHGVFRSDDNGGSWVRINDDQHQYGWIGMPLTGDPRVYGRVYLGTNGRGILYGDIAN